MTPEQIADRIFDRITRAENELANGNVYNLKWVQYYLEDIEPLLNLIQKIEESKGQFLIASQKV